MNCIKIFCNTFFLNIFSVTPSFTTAATSPKMIMTMTMIYNDDAVWNMMRKKPFHNWVLVSRKISFISYFIIIYWNACLKHHIHDVHGDELHSVGRIEQWTFFKLSKKVPKIFSFRLKNWSMFYTKSEKHWWSYARLNGRDQWIQLGVFPTISS